MPNTKKRNSRKRKAKRRLIKNEQKKYRKIINITISIIIIFICLLIGRTFPSAQNNNTQEANIEHNIKEDYSQIEGEKYEPKDTIINITAVGNILYNSELYENLYSEENDNYTFVNFLSRIQKYIENSDYSLAFLGGNIVENYIEQKNKNLMPKDLLLAIKASGIKLLNTANKNSNDEGKERIIKTLELIEEQKISHIGTARAQIEAQTPKIEEILGIKIAFLSYTETLNKALKSEEKYLVNTIDKNQIKEDIQSAKQSGAEYIVIMINWGKITNNKTTKNQEELAKYLINSGADFIIGNNNNGYMQEVQIIENSEGKKVGIAYSIGDFIAQNENSNIEIILNIELTKYVESGKVELTQIEYIPIYLLDKGKDTEERFSLIDLRQQIERHETGVKNVFTEEEYNKAKKELEKTDAILSGN